MVEVEYRGISFTVYDAAGETGTLDFPDIHLVLITYEETRAEL